MSLRWQGNHYVLGGEDGRTPVLEPDIMRWAEWFEHADRSVAVTGNAARRVSTVFLGLDHNFSGRGRGLFFETMVFGGEHDHDCKRYSTWEEAEAGHRTFCALVFGKAYAEGREYL